MQQRKAPTIMSDEVILGVVAENPSAIQGADRQDIYVAKYAHQVILVNPDGTPVDFGGGGGEGGPVTWANIQNKPTEFAPTAHSHSITDVEGLEDRLDEVFTQVSSGKSLLETKVLAKGGTVVKVGEIATFEELSTGIDSIPKGSETPQRPKLFSDDHPLPFNELHGDQYDGYIIHRNDTEGYRLYAIKGHMAFSSAVGGYQSTGIGWDKWVLENNRWAKIRTSTDGPLGGTGFETTNDIIEVSHNVIKNGEVTAPGRFGYQNWVTNVLKGFEMPVANQGTTFDNFVVEKLTTDTRVPESGTKTETVVFPTEFVSDSVTIKLT